jgi:UDP-2,3-diacylglucosamine pyrophosphatase LpxH
MIRQFIYFFWLFFYPPLLDAQELNILGSDSTDLYFVSDTQQPMFVETLVLKPHHNEKATAAIFSEFIRQKPRAVFMLGDVVALGFANHKWARVDRFLDSIRREGTPVFGLLGNHEVLGRDRKGEKNFQVRFPLNIKTGYVTIQDSIAIILLNSNFGALSSREKIFQDNWYRKTLESLDKSDSVLTIIVCCHHAPYTNSTIVHSSTSVQENFVPAFLQSGKAKLFISGHSHSFEHFNVSGKNFLVIGGGGGLHQPLDTSSTSIPDLARNFKPLFHYVRIRRQGTSLIIRSFYLKEDFIHFNPGYQLEIK